LLLSFGTTQFIRGFAAVPHSHRHALSANRFVYAYQGAGRLVTQITLPTSAKVVRGYDTLGRLTSTALQRQDNADLNRYSYTYTDRHQVNRHTRFDASYVNCGYDDLGQLTSALGFTSGDTPIANETLGYQYNGAWNMTQRSVNGTPTD
jgi:hypothetical protein